MRYELTDYEWFAIKPMLPNKSRGVPRVNDRRVIRHLLDLAIWSAMARSARKRRSVHDLLQSVRSLATGGRVAELMRALAGAHDAAVQMIDTSIVRVHQHGACITRNRRQSMGRSRGGLTSKIQAVVDSNGLPIRLALSPGESHDVRLAGKLLSRLKSGSMLLTDRGYDAGSENLS